jgi:hypothetical protein
MTSEGTEKPITPRIKMTLGRETESLLGFLCALSVLCGETLCLRYV